MMISLKALEVDFGPVKAVRGVSFDVPEGASFGLVGESGSGKTTVLRVLGGAIPPTRGTIEIDGRPLVPDKAFYRALQMVFQDPYGSLHPRQTIDRILSEPLLVHGIDDHEVRIARALDEVSLPSMMRFRYPHQLSGGQRQRVAIARALMVEPRILLLDEPTSALDVSVQAEILNLLSDLRKRRGLTYVLVSHNLPVVSHLCDQLAVMQQGTIVEVLDNDALRARKATHPHTRELIDLSLDLEENVMVDTAATRK